MEHSILVYIEREPRSKSGQGKMYICPVELKVQMGDSVRWLCNYLDEFSCTFMEGSPFEGHDVVRGKDGHTVFLTIDNTGKYHYRVNEGQLEIDPIIIVDPSE